MAEITLERFNEVMDALERGEVRVAEKVDGAWKVNSWVKEVIFALASTMEGDTTNFYISKRLQQFDVKLSVIARGISVGDELEYTDELTLGRSIVNRVPFE